jgi:hypothetical protein
MPPPPAGFSSEEVVPPVSFERALGVPPHVLAQGYLWVSNAVIYAWLASISPLGEVHLDVDGRAVTITQANAQAYLAGFEGRMRTMQRQLSNGSFPWSVENMRLGVVETVPIYSRFRGQRESVKRDSNSN